jgi:putative SOS response-associated peptidase YedK
VEDPANGQWLQSYTIITTDANELMASVHDRMPFILHPGDFDRWIAPHAKLRRAMQRDQQRNTFGLVRVRFRFDESVSGPNRPTRTWQHP